MPDPTINEFENRRRSTLSLRDRLICLAVLASVWGLIELIGGETVWLVAAGLLLLGVGRALVNRAGIATAMAAVAVLYRSVNTAPFFCHLVGIGMLGVAFDIAAALLWRDDRRAYLRAALTGVAGAYLSCFLFVASMVWVFEYAFWADGGIARVADYTLTSGTRGALTGLILVPAGLWLGRQLVRQAGRHPRFVWRAAVATAFALWIIGPLAG